VADGMPPRGKMREVDLLALIHQQEQASLGSEVAAGATVSTTVFPSNASMPTLQVDRYNALNAYLGRPLGNEIENRSQIVLPELRDTIEWIMPQLMRMFVSAKYVCRFDAENQADEKQAELETAVVNHLFMSENNGFFVLQDFFKDALLLRNGYAEVYTKEYTDVAEERYTGLTETELQAVMGDDEEEVEVLEQREYTQDVMPPLAMLPPGAPVQVQKVPAFDIKIRRSTQKKRTCVHCLPPEEMRITPRARGNMEDLHFSAHITTATRSDLLAEGYSRDIIDTIAASRPNWIEIDALARNQVVDQLAVSNPSDFSMEEVELRKVIVKVDFDGDGIAELRRVIVAGDKVIDNEVIEETPFASCVPKRMPHRHTGISLYDEVMDLQIIKTGFLRAGIDNLTIANNLRYAVDWRNTNIDDLLTSRPHGPIRGNGPPQSWIMPIQPPSNLTDQVLPAMQYIDELRANRTGIGRSLGATDPNELQDVTKGAMLAQMSAAALKVEMCARLLAEGVKDIFRKLHAEFVRHQDQPLEFSIAGQWVNVDPTQWRKRDKVTVNVGLGNGNREEMRANVMLLGQAQGQLAQLGLVGPQQAFETFKLVCEALGFANPERYAMDPTSQAFQQHMQQMQQMQSMQPPAPPVQVAQIKAKADEQAEAAETQREAMRLKAEGAGDQRQQAADAHQADAQMAHEVIQNHSDRLSQESDRQSDLTLALIKALSPIIAGQLKGDESANAGQVLANDTRSAQSGMDPMAPLMQQLQQAIAQLNGPRTAVLPDGRKITIQ
jgi:hypothetical protein